MAQLDEIVGKENINQLIDLNAKINLVNDSFMNQLKIVSQINTAISSNTGTYKELKVVQDQVAGAAKKLGDTEKQSEKIAKDQAAAMAALDKQRQSAYATMAKQEAKEKELADAMSKEAKSLEELNKQNKALKAARDKVDTSTDAGKQKITELNKRIDENNAKIKDNVSGLEKQKIGIGAYEEGIKNALSKMGPFGAAINQGIVAMKSYTGATTEAAVANQTAAVSAGVGTKAMKILKIAIASTGIGLLIIAVGSLYAYFTKTERGAMKLKEIMAQFRAVINVLFDRVIMLGEGLYKIFTGEFKEGWKEMKEAFQDIGAEIKEEVKLSKELAQAENQLILLRRKTQEQTSANSLELQKQMEIMKTEGNSLDEKLVALAKAKQLTRENSAMVAELNRQEIANLQQKIDMGESTTEDFDELSALKTNANNLEKAAQMEMNSLLKIGNKLNKEASEEKQKAIDEEIKARTDLYYQNNKTQEQEYQDYVKLQEKKAEAAKGFTQMLSDYRDEEAADDLEGVEAAVENINAIQETAKTAFRNTQDLRKLELDSLKALYDRDLITYEEYQARKREIDEEAAQEAVAIAGKVGQELLDITNFMLDAERSQMESRKAHELQLAGDNKERIAEINEKYAKKESELKTKQAKADKASAMFSAIIKIAQAVATALTAGPGVGIILSVLTAALGAVQLGVIASTPIPQFHKGTDSAPDGVISIGEKGRELIKTKSGQLLLANDQTLATGLKGAKIYTNRETEAMLRGGAFGYDSQELQATLERNNDRLIRTIQNKKEIHINTSKREITERSGGHFKTYKNRYFK